MTDQPLSSDALPPPQPAAQAVPVDEAARLFLAGLELQGKGDALGAINLYVRAIEVQPRFADAYNNIAILLKGLRRLPSAVACLKRAVQFIPNSGALWSNLGNMLWMALDYEPAMVAFRRSLALEPNRPGTYHNLGLLYFSLGDYHAAVESYDRSLAIGPGRTLVMGIARSRYLPAAICWREDTPWYPSVRLFRQAAPRDWTSVITRVRETVAGILNGRG